MSKPQWQDRFPEFAGSEESLEDLLSSGKIPEERYVEWASESFQIPSLDQGFFKQLKNFNLILENPSPEWSSSFFPVHEWQGMLYVACLAPREFTLKKKHCFVVGPYKAMQTVWEKMQKPAAPAKATTDTDKIPLAAAPSMPDTARIPVAAAPSIADTARIPIAAAPSLPDTQRLPVTPEAPVAGSPSWLPVVEEKKQDDSNQTADPFSASVVIPLNQLENSINEARMQRENSESSFVKETSKASFTVNPNLSHPNFKVPEITNVFKMGVPKEMTFTTTKTIMPFPDSTKDFTFIRTVYSEQVIVEAHGKVQDNKDPQEALISAFKVLKDYYKKLMWVVRDQKGRAFPIACNDLWNFTDDAWNMSINFKDANPFRLAKFTQKPYHGPVYKTPVNDMYFKAWNSGKYPDIMTIIPVKMGGKVFGYFVGCDKGAHFHSQQTLEIMESVCAELVDTFIRIHKELGIKPQSA